MTFCPSDKRLVQLLEEQLDRRELVDIELHLERCHQCQEALEELTRERFSFTEWQPSTHVDPASPRRSARLASTSLQDLAHSTTQPSAFGSEPDLDAVPEVEGYEIFERIGQGGMGVVYRARQHGLERMVALKMIRGGSHAVPEHLARFRIEARALARLGHPNVVQIHDVGRSEGIPFVALELLEGGSLEKQVAGTPQSERNSAELVVTLARAIGAAHRAGVVHRDLKSANVLFAADGTPKIVDFGLAKRLDEEDGQTQTGQVMGSPSFMAPEQAQGREVGPLADVYSLGAILYEMLTGRPPFKGASAMETLFQVVNDEPVSPTRLRAGLSQDLETISLKCLDKEPRRRYESAEALADDLDRYLNGTPILARPIGLRERAWKWARRQPALATIALIALIAVIGLGSAAYRGIQLEKIQTEDDQRRASDLEKRGLKLIAEGELALRDHRYVAGVNQLTDFQFEIAKNPRLTDLRDRVQDLIDLLQRSQELQNQQELAHRKFLKFQELRRQVQIQNTPVAVGESHDIREVRNLTRQALEVFGSGDPQVDPENIKLPEALSLGEKEEVDKRRHELLLTLADAVARPLTGEDARQQADQALAILDRAARRFDSNRTSQAFQLIKADCLARKGDAKAANAARQAAASMPADAFAHLLQGESLHRGRKWSAASREFEAALRLENDLYRAQLMLADCQIQMLEFNQARTHLTACLQRDPKAISLLLLRGFASGEEGHQRQKYAQKTTPRLEGLQKEAESLFEAAEADFQAVKALELSTTEHYVLLVNWGALRVRRHRLDNAVSDLVEAIGLRPNEVSAYIILGQAYRQQGKIEAALAQFTRAIELKPEMASLYRSRALTRVEGGTPSPRAREESIQDLTRAIALISPGDLDFAADRARRARLLLQAGRAKEALADTEDALRAVPNESEAHLIRVKSLLELKRFNEVLSACDDALSRGRPSGELYELRGLARASRQEYSSAIQDYTQSLAIDPNRSSPLIQRGWAYLVSQAPSLAILDFDQAIKLAPDEPEAYNGRGFARVLCGQYKEAVEDADASVSRGMNDARTHYNAARIYAKAAIAVISSTNRRNLGQNPIAEKYQDKAQHLIRMALDKMPVEERGDFWRTVVEADPALASLRQRPKFSQMTSQYGRLAK